MSGWADPAADPMQDVLDAITRAAEAARREALLPPKGADGNPYSLVVPGWLDDLCRLEGKTVQQVADETICDLNGRRVATQVTVVR